MSVVLETGVEEHLREVVAELVVVQQEEVVAEAGEYNSFSVLSHSLE